MSEVILSNGTFKTVPRQFMELFTVDEVLSERKWNNWLSN